MRYPDFFDTVPTITLYDPLAEFLGTCEGGLIEIGYLDVVKMAGHSCATVCGAYLMAQRGLRALYPDRPPVRGEIEVALRAPLHEGNTGVVAAVLSNITGATDDTGFTGLQGRFSRRGLMSFGADIDGDVRFSRRDTGRAVETTCRPGRVVDPGKILMSALSPDATDEQRRTFPRHWQEMVRTLVERADEIVTVTEIG